MIKYSLKNLKTFNLFAFSHNSKTVQNLKDLHSNLKTFWRISKTVTKSDSKNNYSVTKDGDPWPWNTFGLDSTPSNSQCIISQRKAFSRNVEIRSCIPMPFGLLLALYLYTLIQTILVQIFLYKHTRLNTRQVFCHAIMYLRTFKPVFHFKRTVPKRIKNVFKFQNFVNIDCMVSILP
jgi:hypothetical protein